MRQDLMTHEQWVKARELGRPSWLRRKLALPALIGTGYVAYKGWRLGAGEDLWETALGVTCLLVVLTIDGYGIYDHSERVHEQAAHD